MLQRMERIEPPAASPMAGHGRDGFPGSCRTLFMRSPWAVRLLLILLAAYCLMALGLLLHQVVVGFSYAWTRDGHALQRSGSLIDWYVTWFLPLAIVAMVAIVLRGCPRAQRLQLAGAMALISVGGIASVWLVLKAIAALSWHLAA
jgi:hypothetical protein